MILLAGDIGGTKTILRLVDAQPSDSDGVPRQTILHEAQYPSQNYPDLVPMVQEFLAAAAQVLNQVPQPQRACFAIAGPVVQDTSELTNLAWRLEGHRLAQALALEKVSLINDFAAVGYGVLGLAPEDCYPLQPGQPEPQGTIGIIGAGTGLGQGFLVFQAGGYKVYATEGGHADFAPRSELEFQLLKYLLDKHGIQRVSVERVVSGQGIVSIYQFLRDRLRVTESPVVAPIVRTWEQEAGREKTVDPAATIAIAAQQQDPLCQKTMQTFVEAYGAEAGNLALKLLPYGGLYIAGGIAAKNLPLMRSDGFIQSFRAKGRVAPLLERVPVQVILNPQVGLIGAALYAARL